MFPLHPDLFLSDNRSVCDASHTFSPHRIHSNCLRPGDSETLSARFQSKKIDLQSASRKLKKIVCPQASMYLQPCFVQISRFALIPKMLWFKIYLIWSSTWDFFGYNLTSAKVLRESPKNWRALKLACIFQDLLTKYC